MWTALRWVGVFICIVWPIYEFNRSRREYWKEHAETRQWTEDDL